MGRNILVSWNHTESKRDGVSYDKPRERRKLRDSPLQVWIFGGKWGKKIGFSIYKLLYMVLNSVLTSTETLLGTQLLLPFRLLWKTAAHYEQSCNLDTDAVAHPTHIPPGARALARHKGRTHLGLTRPARKASSSLSPQCLHLIPIKKVSHQTPNTYSTARGTLNPPRVWLDLRDKHKNRNGELISFNSNFPQNEEGNKQSPPTSPPSLCCFYRF